MSKTQQRSTPAKKKIGLGRGLGSLLGENTREDVFINQIDEIELPVLDDEDFEHQIIKNEKMKLSASFENKVLNLDIEKIVPNKAQPRKHFHADKLKELTQSIQQSGVIQPILVRKLENNSFEIVAGERRWRASQKAGLKQVPVIVKKYKNNEALEVALIENIQRNDLNPIEEAEALKDLIQRYKITQDELAKRLGKERSSITNLLRLLSLSPKIKKMVLSSELSLGQAKVILSLSDWSEQEAVAKKVLLNKMSVRELEKAVKKIKSGDAEAGSEKTKITPKEALNLQLVSGLGEELQKLLGQKVVIDYKQGKGKIKIAFHSDDELNTVVHKIRQSWK